MGPNMDVFSYINHARFSRVLRVIQNIFFTAGVFGASKDDYVFIYPAIVFYWNIFRVFKIDSCVNSYFFSQMSQAFLQEPVPEDDPNIPGKISDRRQPDFSREVQYDAGNLFWFLEYISHFSKVNLAD